MEYEERLVDEEEEAVIALVPLLAALQVLPVLVQRLDDLREPVLALQLDVHVEHQQLLLLLLSDNVPEVPVLLVFGL